jgi:hypothetical protein
LAAAAEREELACLPFFFFGTGPVLKQILNPLISLHIYKQRKGVMTITM